MVETKNIPFWIKQGAMCNYHNSMDGQVTYPDCRIISDPCDFNGRGELVVFLDTGKQRILAPVTHITEVKGIPVCRK